MANTMTIRLYNTLTRQKEEFKPQDPARVTMYACGPTVYNYAHIGNARPAVIFDLLYGVLDREYPGTIYARNITDVDDKINASAAEQGVPIDIISRRYSEAYHEDMAALGVGRPSVEPRATEHITDIIGMIERLIKTGHAYSAEGHVLFDVQSYDNYGALSGRELDDMIAGARVEVAPYKKNPADFVLWKPSQAPQPGWESPWGWGRPGWHIECSVMAEKHLGETIDIHAGGQDLVFPHHENEIAQSVCAHSGRPFARYWLHNGFVTVERRKMSKSLGNTLVVHDLLQEERGEVLRFQLLSAHYRQPLDWSKSALEQSRRTLNRMYAVLRDSIEKTGPMAAADEPGAALLETLHDDINTPDALAELSRLTRNLAAAQDPEVIRTIGAELLAGGAMLGLLQSNPAEWLKGNTAGLDDAEIDKMIAAREAAREARDFARADEIRDELSRMGIVLEDGAAGTRWRREH